MGSVGRGFVTDARVSRLNYRMKKKEGFGY